MKLQKLALAAVFSAGILGMNAPMAESQDGILYKVQAGNTNYCHMKFPAIRSDSLASDRPVLQDSSTGAIIDFYGPCDFDPTGKQAVLSQKQDARRMFSKNYND
jgi:hypothetical protein